MAVKKWEFIKQEKIISKPKLEIWEDVFCLPNNKQKGYYIRKQGNVAKVFGITTDQKIILIQQFRPGPKEVLYELPGGFTDKGESPMETAKREFLEETGYTGKMDFLTSFWSEPYTDMLVNCFIATNCRQISDQKTDPDEFIEVCLLTKEQLKGLFFGGKMRDIGICFLAMEKLGLISV